MKLFQVKAKCNAAASVLCSPKVTRGALWMWMRETMKYSRVSHSDSPVINDVSAFALKARVVYPINQRYRTELRIPPHTAPPPRLPIGRMRAEMSMKARAFRRVPSAKRLRT
ncbi:hypothetical protein C0J45_12944 [Silurus meridionalis]|nr:hypothetical protein C0J45_12944 [Silurus meridionalis]